MVVRVKGFPNRFQIFYLEPQSQDAKVITSLMCAVRALNPLVSRVHARNPKYLASIWPMGLRLHHCAEPPPLHLLSLLPFIILNQLAASQNIWPMALDTTIAQNENPPPSTFSLSFLSALNQLAASQNISLLRCGELQPWVA